MTDVEFFLLETHDTTPERFVAKLAQAAYRQSTSVHIHCEDEIQQQQLSELLWQFSQSSFLPNDIAQASPIGLGTAPEQAKTFATLISFSEEVPHYFSRFDRFQWVIANTDAAKAQARAQYRFFKQRSYPLQHHRVQHGQF